MPFDHRPDSVLGTALGQALSADDACRRQERGGHPV